jgi:hypothetical protein
MPRDGQFDAIGWRRRRREWQSFEGEFQGSEDVSVRVSKKARAVSNSDRRRGRKLSKRK